MRSMRLLGICLLAAVASLAAFAAPSQARDRNHDRIPDRWEKRHKLSLKVNQARKDQDRDGLKNRAEFRTQMDPRDDDSATGELTINLLGGGSVTGFVTPDTEVECDTEGDDDSGSEDHDERSLRDEDDEGDDEGDDSEGKHGDSESDSESCPAGALKDGAVVQEAELKLGNGKAVFEEIELVA
jgi:hypothetical protein